MFSYYKIMMLKDSFTAHFILEWTSVPGISSLECVVMAFKPLDLYILCHVQDGAWAWHIVGTR